MYAGAFSCTHNSAQGARHSWRLTSSLQGLNILGALCVFSEYRFLNDCFAAILEEACEGRILVLQTKDGLKTHPEESLSFQHKFTWPTLQIKA